MMTSTVDMLNALGPAVSKTTQDALTSLPDAPQKQLQKSPPAMAQALQHCLSPDALCENTPLK